MDITRETSAFKFSQIDSASVNRATAQFILANMGALRLKERSVLVGLIGELCKALAHSHEMDFTPPSVRSERPHLGDRERYTEEKLQALSEGRAAFDSDYVSRSVALAELMERSA
jgi:hypothetical protein